MEYNWNLALSVQTLQIMSNAPRVVIFKIFSLTDAPDSGGGTTVVTTGNTFTMYIDGTYAYIRTAFM